MEVTHTALKPSFQLEFVLPEGTDGNNPAANETERNKLKLQQTRSCVRDILNLRKVIMEKHGRSEKFDDLKADLEKREEWLGKTYQKPEAVTELKFVIENKIILIEGRYTKDTVVIPNPGAKKITKESDRRSVTTTIFPPTEYYPGKYNPESRPLAF
jgi:hypothetical protein